jgi:hypothetical protein
MNRPPPPSPQQRAVPAQQRPTAAAPAPASARTPPATLPSVGSQQATLAPGLCAPAAQDPQNLGIDPVAAASNDPQLGFEWKPRVIGSNHTWGCVVSAGQAEALSVRVTQVPYDRTLRGVGAVEVIAIPVAVAGMRGTLTARNELTGAAAEFSWTWGPFQPRHAAARAKTVPSGKMAGPAPAAKQASAAGMPAHASQQVGSVNVAALQTRAAGTSVGKGFFGMQATGKRVAFVLDMSGSMLGSRWEKCAKELAGILSSLDESVQFHVVLFSHCLEVPPGQDGWAPADPGRKAAVMSWIESVSPKGGTCPRPAFEQLYSMAVRPSTVFFLTDGQFADLTAEDCARLQNSNPPGTDGGLLSRLRNQLFWTGKGPQGTPTVINTITLDDPVSAPVMQQIAAQSGGQYTHASST